MAGTTSLSQSPLRAACGVRGPAPDTCTPGVPRHTRARGAAPEQGTDSGFAQASGSLGNRWSSTTSVATARNSRCAASSWPPGLLLASRLRHHS